MLRMKLKSTGMSLPAKASSGNGGVVGPDAAGWEMRPGGMLVQKRNSDSSQTTNSIPTVRVRVKYNSSLHEIDISSQASFGDLKKMLAGLTGLHHQDQKLIFKDKERDSKSFLDTVGVKDGSKIVLVEDVLSKDRRFLELCKNAHTDKATKEIAVIRSEVDRLAKQVADLESQICGGKKVVETVLLNLIELLMTQLIKLDGIVADGDVKLKRRVQVKRVQKYIETLDMLKIKSSSLGVKIPSQVQQKMTVGRTTPNSVQKQRNVAGQRPGPVVVTTKWETFESGTAMQQMPLTSLSTVKHSNNNTSSKLKWHLFE